LVSEARLDPDIKDPDGRRVRCLAHIISLVAKAFLFGKDIESLEIHKDRPKTEIKELLEIRQDWLDHGPYGKLHKTIEFVETSAECTQDECLPDQLLNVFIDH
jgi:hypothetical protein